MKKILIVDDDIDISELISTILQGENFETVVKNNGCDAIFEISNNNYDLILLDIMMPDFTGMEVMNKIRDKVECPIIFVTAKNTLVDKMVGFEIGADDYITKPFEKEELVSRVKAHLRRDDRKKKIVQNVITIGDITINKNTFQVIKDNKEIELSTKEFELLKYFMQNAGIVLSKEQIFDNVWKSSYGDIGAVSVYVKSLRNKIDPTGKYIITVWGYGYKFIKEIS